MHREMDRMMEDAFRFTGYPSTLRHFGGGESNVLQSMLFDATSAQTITEKDGQKHVNYHFDVSDFQPEEIEIKTIQNKQLEVKGVHESKTDGGTVKREFHRVVSIPENVKVDELKSVLSPEGVLSVSAPLLEPPEAIKEGSSEKEGARKEDVELKIAHE